jgi:cell division protein ZapA (FtsZ GTPase activity inhibitor)
MHLPQRTPTPVPNDDWQPTLQMAEYYASKGEYDNADSSLARFGARFAGTPDALETVYWRALYKADPANHTSSLAAATALLDVYLADLRPRSHVAEATVLRRLVGALDGLEKAAANASAQAKDAIAQTKDAKATADKAAANANADVNATQNANDEIKRLKEELAKANAELDRIKKRLAAPPPKEPPAIPP